MNDTELFIVNVDEPEERQTIELKPFEIINLVRGFCQLFLEEGSFEIEAVPEGEYVSISNGFVKATYFSIRAGKNGCKVVLTRTRMEQKF